MKKAAIVLTTIILIILIPLVLAYLLKEKDTVDDSHVQTNSTQQTSTVLLSKLDSPVPAPAFNLPDMDGEKHTLNSYKGKPVIINFWATWCPPCRAELPAMNRGWAKIKDEGIAMIAVNVGENEDTIFEFMGDHPIDFTVLLDESSETTNKWPIKGLPTTFILDKEGNLVYRAVGGREWDSDELLNVARELK